MGFDNRILTDDDVQYIRKVYKPHHPEFGANPLARRFGVAHNTICAVVSGTNWSKESYTEKKIRMLEDEFKLRLTDAEKAKLHAMKNERDVDHYARDLIVNKL